MGVPATPGDNALRARGAVGGRRDGSAAAASEADDAARTQFEACFHASAPTLWCIAVSIVGDRTLADDVLQDAAVIAMSKFSEFDPSTSFTAWGGRIVRYVALNAARKRTRQRAVSVSIDPVDLDRHPRSFDDRHTATGIDQRGELTIDQSAFDDNVRDALMELRPTARACLLMRTVLELPYNEIALALGIPEGTAMSHVHRSRAAMRKSMRSCSQIT